MIKKIVALSLAFVSLLAKADEGMWLPLLLKQLNEADMKAKGMKISAEDLYSINNGSLKDAVVQFGGGCTGEVVSNEGLILTNHHCGYGQIQSHSSVEKDYLKYGFWAKNKTEELPCPGLTCTFVIRIEDVTKKILEGISDTTKENNRDKIIAANIKKISEEATKGTHYNAIIRPFYFGNEYYMYVTETFKDVRLVGAPPESIGKFGGDTDNWMWPRHTCDFSVFRIYANDKNEPAEYSANNKPYQPRKFMNVSLKGFEKGDFTITYGFPGRTHEYLTSYGIQLITETSNPMAIKIREKRLAIWASDMKESDKVRIQYSSKFAGVSNYHKKFIGENKGMRLMNTIAYKQQIEKDLENWATKNGKVKYSGMVQKFENVYKKLQPLQYELILVNECLMGVEILSFANRFNALVSKSKKEDVKDEDLKKDIENLKKIIESYFKNYNAQTDKKVMSSMLQFYQQHSKSPLNVEYIKTLNEKYKGDFVKYSEEVFSKSMLADNAKLVAFLDSYKKSAYKKIEKDPAYQLSQAIINNYINKVSKDFNSLQEELSLLHRDWMMALREFQTDKKFWPDANSTLRIAFGTVEPYSPYDAGNYHYVSYLKGVIEKMDNTNDEFVVPDKLAELYYKKDFGQYADNTGDVPVAFIATNHTTGGNSGSPLLDANGNLIGINFDTNWEGTMSNYHFAEERVRNISVDIRYVLFIIDKFAGAGYLLDEMKIVK